MKKEAKKQPSNIVSLEKHLKKKKIREGIAWNREKLEEIADLGDRLVRAVGEACGKELKKREKEIDDE